MATNGRDPLAPLAKLLDDATIVSFSAQDLDAALRTAVRAILAGRQQKKNLEPVMNVARTAFVRSLRRRVRG